jgi:hypothetical protein
MASTVIEFPKTKKPRRETKRDIAERIMPKVFGILRSGELRLYGGNGPRFPFQNVVIVERDGYRFSASHLPGHTSRGGALTEVAVMRGQTEILDVRVYPADMGYRNEIFEGRGWLRRLDFKERASWVPALAAMDEAELSLSGFLRWVTIPGEHTEYPVDPASFE